MSSIKLKHSGGNAVSLNPPTSAPTSPEVAFKLPQSDGSANQLLKTDGSGNLGWATDQGGKLLDFQHYQTTGTLTTTARSFTDTTNFTVTLTPQTNSKVFLSFFATLGKDDTSALKFRIARVKSGTTTYLGISDTADWRGIYPSMSSYIGASDTSNQIYNMGFQWVDASPGGDGSTSIVYKLQWMINAGTGYIGRDSTGSVNSYAGANQYTAWEVGA